MESMLFVEEGTPRGFCNEGCIEKYYAPLVEHYQKIENDLRKHLGIEHEECLKLIHSSDHINSCMNHPHEIWRKENELKEEIYSFIYFLGDKNNSAMAILCTVFDFRPSFVFLLSVSSNLSFLKEFQIGEKISDPLLFLSNNKNKTEQGNDKGLSDQNKKEILSTLDYIRSSLLADLIALHSKADIPIENYIYYDDYLEETMIDPDEVYSFNGPNKEDLIIHLKAYQRDNISFYYFVICFNANFLQNNEGKEEQQVIPLLAFPSLDGEIYKHYRQGKQILGSLKN